MRVDERDREAVGTLHGSALALRRFLFFVPQVLFTVGIGSVSGIVFSSPGVRAIPHRYPRIARYFDIDHQRREP